MNLLVHEFESSGNPHKYLVKVYDNHAIGAYTRLQQAADNLGIPMQTAYQNISRHECEEEDHFLIGIALAQEGDYPKLFGEFERLNLEASQNFSSKAIWDQSTADTRMLERYLAERQEGEPRQIAHDIDWAFE